MRVSPNNKLGPKNQQKLDFQHSKFLCNTKRRHVASKHRMDAMKITGKTIVHFNYFVLFSFSLFVTMNV